MGVFMTLLRKYKTGVEKAYMDLFNVSSLGFLNMKNLLTFFLLLSSHLDAIMAEDIRQKVAPMFNSVVQRALNRALADRQTSEVVYKNSTRLFGGKNADLMIL